jgi:hypothetical protein
MSLFLTLVPRIVKQELRENLTRFVQALQARMAACKQRQGHLPVTKEISDLAEEICCLSRRILFRIWPPDDGEDLTAAVINLFLVAADQIPESTAEYPRLSDFAENLRLRAQDLQPYVSQAYVSAGSGSLLT